MSITARNPMTLMLFASLAVACNKSSTTASAIPPQPEATTAVSEPAPAVEEVAQTSTEPPSTEDKIRAALAAPERPEAERQRDQYRHPLETLAFFGLRDDMTVLEIAPGTGWYTSVLAPVLAERGKLLVTNIDPAGGAADKYPFSVAKQFEDRLAANPQVFGAVQIVRVDKDQYFKNWGADASVDLILTFRNAHNWIEGGKSDKFFAEAFRVLKPGGVFGVVDHRAAAGADPKETTKKGYVAEDVVIKLVEKAGFKLAEKSELNANPKDTKDYAQGVWTLPPVLALGDKDKDKYLAIGESDRMTLKFVKPEAAATKM